MEPSQNSVEPLRGAAGQTDTMKIIAVTNIKGGVGKTTTVAGGARLEDFHADRRQGRQPKSCADVQQARRNGRSASQGEPHACGGRGPDAAKARAGDGHSPRDARRVQGLDRRRAKDARTLE